LLEVSGCWVPECTARPAGRSFKFDVEPMCGVRHGRPRGAAMGVVRLSRSESTQIVKQAYCNASTSS
jgi:hypothetical protein